MATTDIIVDSEQVLGYASQMENDNKQLQDLLNDSKSAVDSLSSYWQGKASDDTRAAYDSFANKYFQTYYDVLNQYVKFLRTNVAEQYEHTESVNVKLADAFK